MDEIFSFKYDLKKTFEELSITINGEFALLVFHPVSEELKTNFIQFKNCLNFLNKIKNLSLIAIFPNSDSGSELISNYLSNFLSDRIFKFRNISRENYLNLLNSCKFIIGNSSSGIIEAPALKTPAINIGRRQEGRLRGINVIDCPDGNLEELENGFKEITSSDFIKKLEKVNSPYGQGDSTDKIIDIIKGLEPNSELLTKEVTC
jgi:GDP/UDP-N,N'-diacetylbacillosamine 2-epimerase (hydrolysing)